MYYNTPTITKFQIDTTLQMYNYMYVGIIEVRCFMSIAKVLK